MRVGYAFVLFVIGCMVLCLHAGESVSAANADWTSGSYVISESFAAQQPTESDPCPANRQYIQLSEQEGMVRGCVFGENSGIRLARYDSSQGYRYALAYPSDLQFYPLDGFCEDMARCAYSQAGDAVIVQRPLPPWRYGHSVYQNFSLHIHRQAEGAVRYRFIAPTASKPIVLGDWEASTGSLALSRNGEWAVIEVQSFGFMRMNMRTLEYTRVVAPGAVYGHGNDPLFELAISSSGSLVAITGRRAGTDIYRINSTCGDKPSSTQSRYFLDGAEPCEKTSLADSQVFVGSSYSASPRFLQDGLYLRLGVVSSGSYKEVVFSSRPPGNQGHGPASLYVALGDSYTSGEGETDDRFYLAGTDNSTNRCHISSRSYPYLVGAAWALTTKNIACSGATMADVRYNPGTGSSQIQSLGQLRPLVASLGVGGNDIGLMGKLKTCLGINVCEWARPNMLMASAQEIRSLFSRLTSFIDELKEVSPESQLMIVGYPRVISSDMGAPCSLMVGTMLANEERRYMDESIRYLNNVIEAAAIDRSIAYLDIEDAYIPNRLCDETDVAMNAVRTGNDFSVIDILPDLKIIGAESFHPTPYGHKLASDTILRQHHSAASVGDTTNTGISSLELLNASEYWNGDDTVSSLTFIQQIAQKFLKYTTIIQGGKALIDFPPSSFGKNVVASIEIHSETQIMGSLMTNDDGSLSGEVSLPGDVLGTHTIHVISQSESGEAIDAYQVVSVVERGKSLTSGQPSAPSTHKARAVESVENSASVYESGTTIGDFVTTAKELSHTPPGVLGSAQANRGDEKAGGEHTFWHWWAILLVACLAAVIIISIVLFAKIRRTKSISRNPQV